MSGDTFKIVVSTDNHLGYQERDSVRCDDAFYALEEVLSQARDLGADFVILGGDLFHDHTPTQYTLNRAFQIFSRYVLGPAELNFTALASPIPLNFTKVGVNISLPVFVIHGNHDDPSIDTQVSALHLMNNANFVNYLERPLQTDRLVVEPVVLQKGRTVLAIYGIGYMKDDRFNRLLRQQQIEFKPVENAEGQVFNLLIVHQNRFKGSHSSALHDFEFPPLIDLIIWGHEHEAILSHRRPSGTGYSIIQPGSSVATSLIEAEAKQKHLCLLEIKHIGFRDRYIPLQKTRPILCRSLELQDCASDREAEEVITKAFYDLLTTELPPDATLRPPLVRIKAELGQREIRTFHLNQSFSDKTANRDIVSVWRRKQRSVHEVHVQEEVTHVDGIIELFKAKLDSREFQLVSPQQYAEHLSQIVEKNDLKALEKLFQKKIEMARAKVLQSVPEEFNEDAVRRKVTALQIAEDQPSLKRPQLHVPTSFSS